MPRFQNLSLRRLSGRIFFAFMVLLLLVALNGGATFYFLGIASNAEDEQSRLLTQLNDSRQIEFVMNQQAESIFVYTRPGLSGMRDLIEKERVSADDAIKNMAADFKGSSAANLFNDFLAKYTQAQRDFDTVLTPGLAPSEAERNFITTQTNRTQLFDLIKQLQTDRDNALKNAREQNHTNLDTTVKITALVLGLSILITLLLAFFIPRMISRPLKTFSNNLSKMAVGDLTSRFDIQDTDEIAELGLTLNRTVARLRLVIARIQAQTKNISDTSQYMERTSTDLASSLSQQAIAVSQISATVGELSGTSQQIADSASLVANSAGEALQSAEKGYNTMLGASSTMSEIHHRVNQIADRIIALNAVAQRIREATTLISTLSDDTHLLALNAAIESAGAGEEGARFAVVAGQVRKLAQRSRQAAVEIQQLVSQIQQATSASVMATEEGLKVAVVGQQMVEDSLKANQDIIGLVQQTSQLAQAISLATDQQRLANSQVAETMHELARIISSISTNSQQYLTSANDLSEVANQLNNLVSTFKIKEEQAAKAGGGSGAAKIKEVGGQEPAHLSQNGAEPVLTQAASAAKSEKPLLSR